MSLRPGVPYSVSKEGSRNPPSGLPKGGPHLVLSLLTGRDLGLLLPPIAGGFLSASVSFRPVVGALESLSSETVGCKLESRKTAPLQGGRGAHLGR